MTCLEDHPVIKTILTVMIFLTFTVGIVFICLFLAGVFSPEEVPESPDGTGQGQGRVLQTPGIYGRDAIIAGTEDNGIEANKISTNVLDDSQYLQSLDQETLSEYADILEEELNRGSQEYHDLIQDYKDLYKFREEEFNTAQNTFRDGGEFEDSSITKFYKHIEEILDIDFSHDDFLNSSWDEFEATLEQHREGAKTALRAYENDNDLMYHPDWEADDNSRFVESGWRLDENERVRHENALVLIKQQTEQSDILNNNIIPQAPFYGGEGGNGIRRLLAATCA